MAFWTTRSGVARTLTALAVAAGSLNAQAKKCDLPLETNGKLLLAAQTYNGAFKPNATPAEKAKALSGTIKALTDDVSGFPAAVQPSRSFLQSEVLRSWLDQPGIGLDEARGKLGYTANPTATINIPLAIDTAYKAIRAAKPECSDSLKIYGTAVWGTLINKAAGYANGQQLDSAETFARASMIFDDKSYFAYNIMASVAMTKNDTAGMAEWFQKTADVTAAMPNDTNAVKVRDNMLMNLGALFSNAAQDASDGAKKTEFNQKAAAAYSQYLKYYPNDLSTRLRVMRLSGVTLDSAAASKFVDEVLANADNVSDSQLVEAGNEMMSEKYKFYTSGLRLFEAALKKNPNSRDALYNGAVALNNLERFDAVAPFFARLRTIDPNNPGIYNLARNVQTARRLAIQTRANKGVRPRPGQTVPVTPAQQAQLKLVSDSLIYYSQLSQNLNPTVEVRAFSPVAGGVKIGAVVQVPPDKPASTFTVTFEFLDATGAVVATQPVTTKQIAPGGFESVSAEGKGAGIVAFRYKVTK